MKILEVHLAKEDTANAGLQPVSMKKLGEIVLIAGKNGAGKSRLLNAIIEHVTTLPNSKKDNYKARISEIEKEIAQKQSLINDCILNIRKDDDDDDDKKNQYNILLNKTQLEIDVLDTEKAKHLYLVEKLFLDETTEFSRFLKFSPKSEDLTNPINLPQAKIKELAESVKQIGTNALAQGSLSAIQIIQNKYFNATHAESGLEALEIESITKSYYYLKELIKTFLHTNLSRNIDNEPTLFGRTFSQMSLSNGQEVLLQFCIVLYAQGAVLNDLVLFMDEPENHLHPEALIEVIDAIRKELKDGQIWIATHSVHLLAHFDPSDIHYMENGKVTYAGNIPEDVLKGLLGSDEEREKLSRFLSLPEIFGLEKFAQECLLNATVVMTGKDDPQIAQITEAIEKLKSENKKLKVLDYGAGKGRLIATLKENDPTISEWLDYYAYDPSAENRKDCISNISLVYENAEERYFSNHKTIKEGNDQDSFDLITLTNVFHEIDPTDWLDQFDQSSLIYKYLKPTGTLLIVEDQLLPVGERAHSYGFLLFDTVQFKKLFKIEANDVIQGKYIVKSERDGRLKAHYFKKECIGRITTETRRNSITELHDEAVNEIKAIRKKDPSYKNGKLHAFWTQQLANSTLALREL